MQTRLCLLFIKLYLLQFDNIALQNKTQNAFKRAQVIEVDLIHYQRSAFNFSYYNKNALRNDLKLHYVQTSPRSRQLCYKYQSIRSLQNCTTLKHRQLDILECVCFRGLQNYTTLKRRLTSCAFLCSFRGLQNYTTLKL